MDRLNTLRDTIRSLHRASEDEVITALTSACAPAPELRQRASERAIRLITHIRSETRPSLMEAFLSEYGLSTDEGVALMCLAEALLRVPDAGTMDDLIEDKIAPSSWGEHLGKSASSLVNASTWALMLTGSMLDTNKAGGVAGVLRGAVKRLGEPVIRTAVKQAMKELGRQFVLGETIESAAKRAREEEARGYTYSYDMLGEAAMTAHDADAFMTAYKKAIAALAPECSALDIRDNPGISIKLSALHPRYDILQKDRVMSDLVPRVVELAEAAKAANMGLNIDAEEADRLDLSLDIIEAVLSQETLTGWDGFGVVVQAYAKRAGTVIDWLYALAETLDRNIMVRLVKGAYWDSEIKRAQIDGVNDFPVFTRKAATDAAYIACACKLIRMSPRIYPQFATHNAHTVASILEMVPEGSTFEFQRLHGMGEALHEGVRETAGTRCRIYAPVGAHRDLLAYLVRRLLENGANSSFVNQIVDPNVPAEEIAIDPFTVIGNEPGPPAPKIVNPQDLYGPSRRNAKGWDLRADHDRAIIEAVREPFQTETWFAGARIAGNAASGRRIDIFNPAAPDDRVGTLIEATLDDVETALSIAQDWSQSPVTERAAILRRASDLFEAHSGEIFALLAREAGKTPLDAINELREAVDFLRFYAKEAETGPLTPPRGLFACISPWNFPLAIFTGQIAAALATGNGVIAKPAEETPLIAGLAIRLLHNAGVPRRVLQMLPGDGATVGAALTCDPRIKGVCFTGSTETAHAINRSMADTLAPDAPLIAETGGINAMIVDSTALPEQAVRDILASAFQSAGQRCSALRILYLQDDIADAFQTMLFGAMEELSLGQPWAASTDIGPVISKTAQRDILDYIDTAKVEGRLLKQIDGPSRGYFVAPAVIAVKGIEEVEREVFGPVLHIARFKASKLTSVIEAINQRGYGLTFGLHSRIDNRVEDVTRQLKIGNIYINRNQIGAVVGAQPFGGEGLSGTGPKAGGPHYLKRFTEPTPHNLNIEENEMGPLISLDDVHRVLAERHNDIAATPTTRDLPGPTGESNRLLTYPRGLILCLGPGLNAARLQAKLAGNAGCPTLIIAPGAVGEMQIDGTFDLNDLREIAGVAGIALWAGPEDLRIARQALAGQPGPILPLMTHSEMADLCVLERHICIDTTAAGGNTSLMAAMA